MANKSCQSCADLQNDAPGLIVNGMTETECTSLMNDTGLSPASGNNDCTDLNNMNDCLIGNLEPELDSYDVCEWKEFTKNFVNNTWTVLKGIICAICGLWANIHELWNAVKVTGYVGVLTLYRTSQGEWSVDPTYSEGETGFHTVSPPFQAHTLSSTLPDGTLNVGSNYQSVVINNTTGVPLFVEATFNCSIRTTQRMACCYVSVYKDGYTTGQTPFITPSTYDQQVSCEPFILQPGQSTTLSWAFTVGRANNWFISEFGTKGGDSAAITCCLDAETGTVANQRSYFVVTATALPVGVTN